MQDHRAGRSCCRPWTAAFVLWAVTAGTALGCRPRIIDPFQWLRNPDSAEQIQAIYIGEVVGARNPRRLEELRRCRAPDRRNDNETTLLDCMEWTGQSFEVEIWPTQVLYGKADYPSRPIITGCLTQPPRLGTLAVVLVTAEGWGQLRVQRAEDPGFGWFYDDAWLARLQACLADRTTCADPAED